MDLVGALLGVAFILLLLLINRLRSKPAPWRGPPPPPPVGDITTDSLQVYCGYDFMKPILIAIRGLVYDVSDQRELYGPGKPLHVYAGKEISRALALESLNADDIGSAKLHDLSVDKVERIDAKVQELQKQGVAHVGQVVPPKDLTLEQLSKHDGSNKELPLYLSIQGVVYDITKGSHFYGPDGVYPFAGRECARALALLSTETSDCNDNLEGMSYTELETLRDWKAKFTTKYPIIGRLVPSS